MLHRRTRRNQSRAMTSLWLSVLCAAAALNLALGSHDHGAHTEAPGQVTMTAHVSPIDAALCLIRQLLGIPCDYDPSDTDDTPGPPPPPMPDEPVT